MPPHAQAALALGRRATRAPTLSVMETVAEWSVCMRDVAAVWFETVEQHTLGITAAEGGVATSRAETARRTSGLLSVATVKER
jgi:hypothetical protein